MEAVLNILANDVALGFELVAIGLLCIGGVQTLTTLVRGSLRGERTVRRRAWLSFAGWILLGLEFTLAADVVRTAIAPTWTDIGQLAAIAVVRTFLNLFLERDWETASREVPGSDAPPRADRSAPSS